MPEVLAVEMAALLSALVSIAAADFVYHSGRIGQPLHSLWVAFSIAAACLPILAFIAGVFVGPGARAWTLVGTLEALLLLGLYRNLRSLPAGRKLGHGLPPPPAGQPRPPAPG